jgi:FkbH-like protein
MNPANLPLELILRQSGEPPYSPAQMVQLLDSIAAQDTPCTAAELARLEQLAAALAAADPEQSHAAARHLESARTDAACWLRAALLEASGQFAEAAAALALLREKAAGEERASLMLASARNLFRAGRIDEIWRPLAEACKESTAPRTLRNADRLLAQARRQAAPPFRRHCRVALLSTFTIDFLAPLLRAHCYGAGIDAEIYIGPFHQYEQEIRQPDSGLARFRPDIVALATDWRSLGLRDEEGAPAAILSEHTARLTDLWREARDRFGATVIQFNFECPPYDPLGSLSTALDGGRGRLLRALNLALFQAARETAGVVVLDVDQIAARFGKDRWHDPVLWHAARQYPSAAAMPALSQQLTALLRAILGLACKCLALDLDGVLWGGVIGEDGLEGIELGGTPAGEAFVEFQRYLQSLARTGVLLAVCSKNNAADAVLPFRSHPEMVLRERDMALFVAGWNPKDDNLRRIAAELNIGLDAIAFVDDNPAERARIRHLLPEVEVVDLPADPALYPSAISRRGLFESLSITAEDRARTASIQQNVERRTLASSAAGLDDYLAQLEIKVRLAPFDEPNLPRIVQLVNKTNQFNLTTRRRSDAEIRALLAAGAYTQALRAADRFGDNGLTGVLIAVADGADLRIDTWLMSCRVMGRRLEEVMLAALVRHAAAGPYTHIRGEYIPTAKNKPVEDLYTRLGFTPAGEQDEVRYFRRATSEPFEAPLMIECVDLTGAY